MFTFDENIELVEELNKALFVFKWGRKHYHCLDKMSKKLSDSRHLLRYFSKNENRLKYYRISKENAIIKTMKEVVSLRKEIYDCVENGKNGENPNLDDLFEPLHKSEYYDHPGFYTDFKAKGHPDVAPWIRIYAIKLDSNVYAITGYGIKLVEKMQDDKLLVKELEKLKIGSEYLKSIGLLED